MIVRVAVDTLLDRLFDYAVPAGWEPRIAPGLRVRVPFGGRTVTGYVVEPAPASTPETTTPGLFGPEHADGAGHGRRVRSILSIEDERPFLSDTLVRLCRWIAEYYCAPVDRTIRGALPAPVREGGSRAQERLFVTFPEPTTEAASGSEDASKTCGEARALTSRQQELLDNLRRVDGGALQAVCREFKCAPETIRKLAAAGHLALETRQVRRNPLANRRILPTAPLELMPEQAAALALVKSACDEAAVHTVVPKPILLFGVTGSGKTEVYLQAIAHVLAGGGGAIVRVPEIALTPQTVQRFAGRFGDRIAVLHSALGDGERHDEWHRIRNGQARVVVGPRSAVFAPVSGLGLIVVDEEHEPSYKQDEAPRYNARDVAVMRSRLEGCAVVLGTATPAMESWLNVQRGKYLLAPLSKRVVGRPMPFVQIVDMRVEAVRSGRVQVFSQTLIDAVQARLQCGEQVILFLNRRGYATSLVCTKCGYVAECDACSVAYTYHQVDTCLRCHTCGAWKPVPACCPGCADPAFRFAGFGTQRVETIVHTCFPQARIARMDADATSRRHSHDEILGEFRSGRTDILIGTQMIAKGLDFPNVTLVGVLLADASLHMPDFRAGERTFQLLAQVSGRAGRGEVPGEVIVQTYSPNHPAVEAARDAAFERFAAAELADRREAGFPPYVHLVCLTFKGVDEAKVAFVAQAFAKALAGRVGKEVTCADALPAPLARAKGVYRYQLLLRAASVRAMTMPLRAVVRDLHPPTEVALTVDVDAVSIM